MPLTYLDYELGEETIYSVYNCFEFLYDQNQRHSTETFRGDHLPKLMKMNEEEEKLIKQLNGLSFKLYWLATTRPDLINEEKRGGFGDRKPPTKWLGKNYKIPKEASTNRSKATHIRKGHFRRQPCGEGRKDRKIIWLEPMFINAVPQQKEMAKV